MKSCKKLLLVIIFSVLCFTYQKGETIREWYNNAQQRIDTLRKGTFGIKIIDKNGNTYQGDVSVRMVKHEYPFGIAFDLYEGDVNYGNTYSTSATISASSDAEIYRTERWYSFIAYAIPVQKNETYRVKLKFAEIYFNNANNRLFDVFIEGEKKASNIDVFVLAGGKNIAFDTTFIVTVSDSLLEIEFASSIDNAAIKGIEISKLDSSWIKRINCGGGALTTSNGNFYESDTAYFNKHAARVATEEDWMKAVMPKYFNYGVSGNSFKWSGIQPQPTTPNYTNFEHAVKWAQSVGWELKAHTLLWGGYNYEDDHALPRWVKDLPTPQAIYDTCKMRVIREVTRYKGIIKEYDVINEPLHATYLMSVVGDSIIWNSFKWARSADPDAQLIVNDYNVEYYWGDARKYRDLILKMKSMGAPVTGVGMQAHFWQGMRPNLEELVTNVNIVAEAGLPIKFTEFDNGILTEEEQAEDFAMVATIAFSHPMMNGMICWGLSDRGAWREKSGLFYENHKPKKAADTLYYLTKKRWATNFDTTLLQNEPLMFKAYYGTYNVEVKFGDTLKVFTVPLLKVNTDSVFVLYENNAVIKGPEVQKVLLENSNTIRVSFDKPIDPKSLSRSDFKFFSQTPIRIQNIYLDSTNNQDVVLVLNNTITPNDFIQVSYFPGSLKSIDGGNAFAWGPIDIKNLCTGLIAAKVINDGLNVEAEFNAIMVNLQDNLTSFKISVNNQPVSLTSVTYKDDDSTKAIFTLATPIKKNDKVTFQYVKGTLKPKAGFAAENSPSINVSNIWPSVVKAYVANTGTQVVIQFNTLIKNVESNWNNFIIYADDQPIEISGITATGTDSTILKFTLTQPILKQQNIVLAYTQGTIKSLLNNSLPSFENYLVRNNSTITNIKLNEKYEFMVYPNPCNDILNIKFENKPATLSLISTEGKVVYSGIVEGGTLVINLSQLNEGIYYLKTIDSKGQIFITKILKLKK